MNKILFYPFFFFTFYLASAQEKFVVFFDSNQFEISKAENKRVQEWLLQNKESKIVAIEGFTDEDGTASSNDTLAKKRVEFIFNLIKDKIKIRTDFKTRSFGENFNQSKNKAENRKVTIYYLLPKDLEREEAILAIKTAPTQPKAPIVYPKELAFQNPDGTKVSYQLDTAFMQKISEAKVGEKLKIDNLNFIINTFIVVNESKGKMYELLLVLKKNPNLKIEIQGHLCCQPVDRSNLSTQRAKAIWAFLNYNGIDKSRLSYKGFGSSMPLFPLPEKDETERAANRRVEILILENE